MPRQRLVLPTVPLAFSLRAAVAPIWSARRGLGPRSSPNGAWKGWHAAQPRSLPITTGTGAHLRGGGKLKIGATQGCSTFPFFSKQGPLGPQLPCNQIKLRVFRLNRPLKPGNPIFSCVWPISGPGWPQKVFSVRRPPIGEHPGTGKKNRSVVIFLIIFGTKNCARQNQKFDFIFF